MNSNTEVIRFYINCVLISILAAIG